MRPPRRLAVPRATVLPPRDSVAFAVAAVVKVALPASVFVVHFLTGLRFFAPFLAGLAGFVVQVTSRT
jgi:hypothetical protein